MSSRRAPRIRAISAWKSAPLATRSSPGARSWWTPPDASTALRGNTKTRAPVKRLSRRRKGNPEVWTNGEGAGRCPAPSVFPSAAKRLVFLIARRSALAVGSLLTVVGFALGFFPGAELVVKHHLIGPQDRFDLRDLIVPYGAGLGVHLLPKLKKTLPGVVVNLPQFGDLAGIQFDFSRGFIDELPAADFGILF